MVTLYGMVVPGMKNSKETNPHTHYPQECLHSEEALKLASSERKSYF